VGKSAQLNAGSTADSLAKRVDAGSKDDAELKEVNGGCEMGRRIGGRRSALRSRADQPELARYPAHRLRAARVH
jgi:hypothetical protein